MKQSTKKTFAIYWQYAMHYRWSLVVILTGIVLGDAAALAAPFWYKKFFDAAAISHDARTLFSILGIIFIFRLFHWVGIRISLFANSRFQTNVMRELENMCFAYLHKHSISFFENNFVGSLVQRSRRFVSSFERIADRLTWDLFPTVYNVGIIIIVLALQSRALAILVAVWVAVFVLFNYFFSLFKLKYDVTRAELDSKVTGYLADTVANYSNVKLFNGYEREKKGYADITLARQRLQKWTWDLGTINDSAVWFLVIALEIALMIIAVRLWQAGALSLGGFVLIQAYILRVEEKMWGMGRIIRDLYESLADAAEMTAILETPHAIADRRGATELSAPRGEVVFDHVMFAYNETRTVVPDLSFTIRPKEKIALVGHSGAGKSTLVKLLLRTHDLTGGKIKVDGQSIDAVTLESLWKAISYVPQDSILFHRTLMDNIRYARPEATDEEVITAAKQAHAHEFIVETPEGYNTFVGERGVKLSGGERQRVAIARAILKNAPILVLDEATSSLDSESEQYIQQALDILMKDKTVVVIAHRLSTIMKMDRIIVVDGGQIVEEGTHQSLLAQNGGMYKKLWDIQAGNFLAE